jgi:hypothetical protein
MNSRDDGSWGTVRAGDAATPIVASFNRYAQSDPLCCPSRQSNVSYRIDTAGGNSLLVPLSVQTVPTTP